ncbi:MAG TPA: oligosaccharide flippase family protein [Bacillota bacterium]|nr:oligosaccharide flippase family protein [Bacillota bacterium]HPT88265.1 oligosaccharide flippase family protein [Bacillota bacterium]
MKARPNLQNFIYLLGSGLLIQLMGTVYRIWLARKIGAEGLGIFQMAYPIYRLLSSIAAIGLPMALTKWVAEYYTVGDFQSITTLKKWSLRVVTVGSVIAGGALFTTAPFLSHVVFVESRVKLSLMVLTIAIPFSALSATLRGYYQGFSRMAPTAVSELTEQIAEIGFTVLALTFFTAHIPLAGYHYPIIGLTIGELVCFVTLWAYRRVENTPAQSCLPTVELPKIEILNYAWPLLLNQIIVSTGAAAESAIIPRILVGVYHTTAESTQWFGILNGMAAPVAYFPLIFLAPLATVLSPQVSASLKDPRPSFKTKLFRYYSAALIMSLLGMIIIYSQAALLSNTLFHTLQPVYLIRALALGLPFVGLGMLNLTILSAAGHSDKILLLSLWAIGLKTALFFIFVPLLGVSGAAWSITMTQIFIFLSSLTEIQPHLARFSVKIHPKWPLPFRFPTKFR